ncbi:hypothetical protein KUW00_15385 [Halomonas sp. DP5N14-9]|uniref:Uncharacterized protein n=1 Tax=Halomonas sp. H10-59 TaxID=2950874 RepID=A0AAU7KND4_9GAMM|nr:hypothetical protein [Halomonas sp. DP5N14-9]MBY5942261.1 hypothetical protein [Halomonas sp. DP5N14-9]
MPQAPENPTVIRPDATIGSTFATNIDTIIDTNVDTNFGTNSEREFAA